MCPKMDDGTYYHPLLQPLCRPLVHFPHCCWQKWSSCMWWLVRTPPVWRYLIVCTPWKQYFPQHPQGHRIRSSWWLSHYVGLGQEGTKRRSHFLHQHWEWLWNSGGDHRELGKRNGRTLRWRGFSPLDWVLRQILLVENKSTCMHQGWYCIIDPWKRLWCEVAKHAT